MGHGTCIVTYIVFWDEIMMSAPIVCKLGMGREVLVDPSR